MNDDLRNDDLVVSLVGTHGSGKGFILENYDSYDGGELAIRLKPRKSFVSGQWASFELPNLREIQTIDRIRHQYLLVGAAECHYRENTTGLFERSPLDVLAYTYFLVDEVLEQEVVSSINDIENEILKHELETVLSFVKEKVFFLTHKFVDILVYVPIDPEIFQMRGNHTDHREIPQNAYIVDEYMKKSLLEYYMSFKNPTRETGLIILNNCKPQERIEMLNDSLKLVRNDSQFVLNHHPYFTQG